MALVLLITVLSGCRSAAPTPETPGARSSEDEQAANGAVPRVISPPPTRAPTPGVVDCGPSPTAATPTDGTLPLRLSPREGVAPGGSHTPLPMRRETELQATIEALLSGEQGAFAVVAMDLSTGRGAAVNADEVFYAASLFKLSVMYEVLNQAEQGIVALDESLTLTPYYESFGLGPRATLLCERFSVREALVAMISFSDNAVAVLLQDLVGAGNINASLEALGASETRLLEEDLPVTAADIALFLDAIASGSAVSEAASAMMVELMLGERFDNGLKAALPPRAVVAHKTGNWYNATHEAAIVYAPGVSYLLVVLTDRDHETWVIEAVSRAVYAYFTSR